MRYVRRCVLLGALVLIPASALPAHAGDEATRRVTRTRDAVRFSYMFDDASGTRRTIRFAVPRAVYRQARSGLTPIDAPEIRNRVAERVDRLVTDARKQWRDRMRDRLDALAADMPDAVRLSYGFNSGELTWKVSGRVHKSKLKRVQRRLESRITRISDRLRRQQRERIRARAERAREEVLRRFAYVRDQHLGRNLVRPDYAAIARDAHPLMRPAARAIAEKAGRDARTRIALALAWLQAIPYEKLETRSAGNGTGFATPGEILHTNAGDCDSKVTALAALLHHLAPDRRVAAVLLPGHAILAVNLRARPDDRTLTLDGERFVLMDPAGPAILPVGRLGRRAQANLAADRVRRIVWMTGRG